ncbi:MAG: Uma2 family endonuclease [Aggregatilineales bacterium]
MASPQRTPEYVTEEDYLAFDLASEFKNEYANGQIYMMAGASPLHSDICTNLMLDIGNQLDRQKCRITQSDMRIKIHRKNAYRYPDIVVTCGERQYAENAKPLTQINPTVLAEVLSNPAGAHPFKSPKEERCLMCAP